MAAEQKTQASSPADKPKRRTAAEQFIALFEKLTKLVEARSQTYTAGEQALAKAFVKEAKEMIVEARGEVEKQES